MTSRDPMSSQWWHNAAQFKFCIMLCYAVPVMPEGVCPYEVSANWACLDGDFAPTTVLAKDGKPLGMIALRSM